jgi:hypothetical protein
MNTLDNTDVTWILNDGSIWHHMKVNLSDYENIDNIDLSGITIDLSDYDDYKKKKKSKRK